MQEQIESKIKQIYLNVLQREPKPSELDFWASKVFANNQSLEVVENEIRKSDEAKLLRSKLEVELWITEIYYDVLKREPDPAGLAFWMSEILQNKKSFDVVENEIRKSDEAKSKIRKEKSKETAHIP